MFNIPVNGGSGRRGSVGADLAQFLGEGRHGALNRAETTRKKLSATPCSGATTAGEEQRQEMLVGALDTCLSLKKKSVSDELMEKNAKLERAGIKENVIK